MTLDSETSQAISPIKRALLALEDMQTKLAAVERAKREPIALVGMGCRLPGGADSPESFWNLLKDGVDAISEVPPERWNLDELYNSDPDVPGKICTRQGGFLTQVDQFEPHFFGLSARETLSLDPQQRLLLEVSWEALENANYPPNRLANYLTGVFIGLIDTEYGKVLLRQGAREDIDAYYGTGNAMSVASGRLSYFLGLKGPSLSVNTACSSSLVAIHLACQSLRSGECQVALAGGVNLILSPETSIAFSRARMLAPDGRCKTFDASANGYGRGEGCGVIVLKRLSDAQADGDLIRAVIRGSAVNHNGRSSSLLSPNGPSQQSVIREALNNGEIEPSQVSYVEVQGAGTSMGESIEVGALAAVYGNQRPQELPLVIGSVKTNIGHLEGAAGIASLLKVVLALEHKTIPAHLNCQNPNPDINWDKLYLKIPTTTIPWPEGFPKKLAGISAFGFGGTNAHVILEEAPPTDAKVATSSVERPQHLLALSAKTPESLKKLAQKYVDYLLAHPDLALPDICFTANTARAQLAHRLAIVATTNTELQEKLKAFAQGENALGLRISQAPSHPSVAFFFSDSDSSLLTWGRNLYDTQPMVRKLLDQCSERLIPYWQCSLLAVLDAAKNADSPLALGYLQPAVFAIEYAVARLWQAWGLEPVAVMGVGIGEYVAACLAGVLSLEDALKFVAEREQLLSSLSQGNEVALIEKLQTLAQSVTYALPLLPIISSVTGTEVTTAIATPEYWSRQLQFSHQLPTSCQGLHQKGCNFIISIGFQPMSTTATLPLDWQGKWLTGGDWSTLLHSLAELYVSGASVNWLQFERDYIRQRVALPTYAWQKQRYWFDFQAPLLNERTETPPVKSGLLTLETLPHLIQRLESSSELTTEEVAILPKLFKLLLQESQKQEAGESQPANQPLQNRVIQMTAKDIQTWLVQRIAREIGIKDNQIDIRAPFDSYGLDSVLAIGLASAAKQYFGIEVAPIRLLHYPTIEALSQYVAGELETRESEFFEL